LASNRIHFRQVLNKTDNTGHFEHIARNIFDKPCFKNTNLFFFIFVFMNTGDKKAFLIGVLASMSAVVAWDLIKYELGILNDGRKKA
tara:strand:+ start:386 stop:646 length:261 start_codon:yes stop_codon:yes gene_type:complete